MTNIWERGTPRTGLISWLKRFYLSFIAFSLLVPVELGLEWGRGVGRVSIYLWIGLIVDTFFDSASFQDICFFMRGCQFNTGASLHWISFIVDIFFDLTSLLISSSNRHCRHLLWLWSYICRRSFCALQKFLFDLSLLDYLISTSGRFDQRLDLKDTKLKCLWSNF